MQIDKKEILKVNGIYTSALWKDWFAVEVLVCRDGRVFRLRYPYKTMERAKQMLRYLNGNASDAVMPDYRPIIHTMENGRVR